LGCRQVV